MQTKTEAQFQLRDLICRSDKLLLAPDLVKDAICYAAGLEYLHQFTFSPLRVVVAAAGKGSRFERREPKVLATGEVGRSLILRVLDVLAPFDPHPIVIVNTETGPAIEALVAKDGRHTPEWILQKQQQGSGQAILNAEAVLGTFHGNVIVAWGDMGAMSERLVFAASAIHQLLGNAMTIPTKWSKHPYVALVRNQEGIVVDTLQERAGDAMPSSGEHDCGAFLVRSPHLFTWLHELGHKYQSDCPEKEQNFLSLIPHITEQAELVYAVRMGAAWESQGVNTLLDLTVADMYFKAIYAQTRRDIRTSCSLASLLDTLAWSTIQAELWTDVQHTCTCLSVDCHSAIEALPQNKQKAIKRFI